MAKRKQLMQSLGASPLALALLLIPATAAVADSITVDDWFVSVLVDNGYTNQRDSHSFSSLQNPFVDSHEANVGQSRSTAWYDFSWSPQTGVGSFRIETDQRAQGVPSSSLETDSSGFIWFTTTTEDLWLTVDIAFSYDLSADYMAASLEFLVGTWDPPNAFFIVGDYASTISGAPWTGTLVGSGQVLVPGNNSYLIRYHSRLQTFGNTAGHFATGAGYIDFQFQPIPEPATVWLLALGALCLRKRTRRHRS